MTDLRQTTNYSNYMKSIGWNFDKIGNLFAYYKKIPILGIFIKIQRPENINSKHINSLIKRNKPFQIIIEPKTKGQETIIKKGGFKQSKSYYVPSKTVQIDLTKSNGQLLREMHYKTRYNIKKFSKSGLSCVTSKNIQKFATFWQTCAKSQRGMFLSQKKEIIEIYKAFGKDAHIVVIQQNKKALSGILMICTKDTAYYMYAASTKKGKKAFAPTINVWETLKLAKKLKCKTFDFEGIYDKRFPMKSWRGFSRFKKSFGGKEITYPGTFHKFLLPFMQ